MNEDRLSGPAPEVRRRGSVAGLRPISEIRTIAAVALKPDRKTTTMTVQQPRIIGRQADGALLIGLSYAGLITHETEGGAFHLRIGSAIAHTRWTFVDEPVPDGLLSPEDLARLIENERDYTARDKALDGALRGP